LPIGSCNELVETIAGWWATPEVKIALGTDVVVAWQCSECLVELTDE